MWSGQITFVKALFFMNRYIAVFSLGFDVAVMFKQGLSDKVCQVWLFYHFALGMIVVLLGQTILLCRIHAIYRQNWRITGALLIPIVLGIIAVATVDYVAQSKGKLFNHKWFSSSL
ncbi:hypothetical protein M422DRAFT_777773 [Sphaerobolus stellatus SS14]|nr:hypothetical protein M422DRAFT_777773 [Sphaerobolus stellatus SS14]